MGIKCSELIRFMEEFAPLRLAEDYDNVGLLIGRRSQEIKKILVCLDVTSKVVEEALEKKADIIVSHHPFIFKGIKRVIEEDPKGGLIYKLIRNGIGVYSAHTNMDFTNGGINDTLAKLLGLENTRNLKKHKDEKLFKIVVFVPGQNAEALREAMCVAGAGWVGNYSDCSFMVNGTGTFKPLKGTNPYIGTEGKLERVGECRLETVVPQDRLKVVVDAMLEAHPYEEVAYDIYSTELSHKEYGFGKIGSLPEVKSPDEFISIVKEKLNVNNVRVIGNTEKGIRNVAVFCGSFDRDVISSMKGADVLVTGDMKYHDCLDAAEMGLYIIDAGHYATEHIMVPHLARLLAGEFESVDVETSALEENPIKVT